VAHLPAGGHALTRVAIRAGVLPPTRFVVLTTGRAGSVLLLSLLDSTPGVRCFREALGRRPLAAHPWRKLHSHAVRAALRGASAWGTSVHPEELLVERVGDRRRWLGRLHDSGFRAITLVRRNPVSVGFSVCLAEARGTWHHQADAVPRPVRLDPVEVLRIALFSEQKAAEISWLVGERSHLALTYEEALLPVGAQQETVDRVRRFLELPPAPATTSLARITAPLSEQVANLDEVVELLAATHLRDHLGEIT
jgi:hypothetical protein